jgi:hypothetical protein
MSTATRTTATRTTLTLIIVLVSIVATAFGRVDAWGSEPPIEEALQAHFGREVNVTKTQEHAGQALEDVCLVLPPPGETCAPGKESLVPGGFTFPNSVAGAPAPSNDVYVTDGGNRVQDLTPAGEVVRVFGARGTGAGQFEGPRGVAIDQTNGYIYVRDFFNWRVEKFTSTGIFVLMFGKEVNTDGSDICTASEEIKCKAGVRGPEGGKVPSQFNFAGSQTDGDVLAVGPGGVVYVADEHRVQEFEENGAFKGEISLSAISSANGSQVTGLAVDGAGDVYVVYSVNSETRAIHKFGPDGVEIQGEGFPLAPAIRQPGGVVDIEGVALDGAGRLAVAEQEHYQQGKEPLTDLRGELYEADTGEPAMSFPDPGSRALGFNGNDELYAAFEGVPGHEVWKYIPLPVARLRATEAKCLPGVTHGTSVTLDCELKGTVNPENVDETEVWFDWGRTAALGSETPKQPIPPGEEPVEVSAVVEGVRPNESGFFFELVGTDANVELPETIKSNMASFTTPMVTPWLGEPVAPFVRAASAVLFGELNPEHARTSYRFEYLPCNGLEDGTLEERWAESIRTPDGESSAYGQIGTTREIVGLQADTTYCYRLHAHSESTNGGETKEATSEVKSFKTAPAPNPRAITGTASGVGVTSAQISGSVDPDGEGALYIFELGVYHGADTSFGVAYSGSAGEGTGLLAESLVVTGLQPGTTYGYRIRVKSSYAAGDAEAVGATMTFTTLGLPTVLSTPTPLGLLAVPRNVFPAVEATPCKRGYHRAKSGKCVKNKVKKKARHKRKARRARNGRGDAKGAQRKGGGVGTRHRKSG